jgi:hypothetical protein
VTTTKYFEKFIQINPKKTFKDLIIMRDDKNYYSGLIYYFFTQESESIKNMKFKYFPKTRVKEKYFAKILINGTDSNKFSVGFSLIWTKMFAKQEPYYIFRNETLSISKKSFEFLEFPFKSSCSHYNNIKNPFNSLSHNHCVRQCIRYHCEKLLNCSCFLLSYRVNQLDFGFNDLDVCSLNLSAYSEKRFNSLCDNLCPIDCKNIEFYSIRNDDAYFFQKENRIIKIEMSWDQNKPFINNIERAEITFNYYFYYIGGLFGVWFGINANQLLTYFINRYSMVSYYFIDILKFLLSSLSRILGHPRPGWFGGVPGVLGS